jgi:sugar lactone lactonase YvrE
MESLKLSEVEEVASGLQFTEGPAWHPDGYLIFSDIPASTIYKVGAEGLEVFRRPSGNSNGLAFDPQGRLVACEHGNRRVSITQPDGAVEPLATHYEGRRLNSPNDVVVKSDGAVYFTDPPYGVEADQRELDFQGVYRVGTDGALVLVADDFVKPNGLCFSPDESLLYIDDTERHQVRVFEVGSDGALRGGRVFFQVSAPGQLRPDGMKADVEGNLYVAGIDGVWVIAPDGRLLETWELPNLLRPSNLCFGDDGRTLYVTARPMVYRLRVRNPGATSRPRLNGSH